MDLDEFKGKVNDLDNQELIDRYFHGSECAALDIGQASALRREVSDHFNVQLRDVIITGSAKLGFTLVHKKDRPQFSVFYDKSDIDLAIISTDLFVRYWKALHHFFLERGEWDEMPAFRRYLARGWLRPDKFPSDDELNLKREWFEYFRNLTASGRYGPYKLSAGIYYDESFWESYVHSSLSQVRQALEAPL